MTATSAVVSGLAGTLSPADLQQLARLEQANLITVQSQAVQCHIDAWAANAKFPVVVDCVMDRTGAILAWMEH